MQKSAKTIRASAVSSAASSRGTTTSGISRASKLKKKGKDKGKLTPKQREKLRAMERELKERVAGLKKEAETLLQEMTAMEQQAAQKAEKEAKEHAQRISILSGICDNFKLAKARLTHEHNKVRNAEIWERYIQTNRLPFPEETQSMHTHLYLWKAKKEAEYIKFAPFQCNLFIETLAALDELIEYPLYSSQQTIDNQKEIRNAWRKEQFDKLDKATFNMIADLKSGFSQTTENDREVVHKHEETNENVKFALCAWSHKNIEFARLSPKVAFPSISAEFVLPAAYRKRPFVFRAVHIEADFFSSSSPTFEAPEGLELESDLSKEVVRCFEVKKEVKANFAEREREKVRLVQQKLLEAQEAVNSAEKNYEAFQIKNPVTSTKSRGSTASPTDVGTLEQDVVKKKRPGKELAMRIEPVPESGSKRVRAILDDADKGSTHRSVILSTGLQKGLDSISIRSSMRRKDRMKRPRPGSSDDGPYNLFATPSLLSVSKYRPKLEVRKASELCFEDDEIEDEFGSIHESVASEGSFDSLDFMFGEDDHQEELDYTSIKELVRNTVVVKREPKTRLASKISTEFKREKTRKRAKSMKKLGEEQEELQLSVSEIFENGEDERQEKYMSSLVISSSASPIVNLRAFSTVGGTYLLHLISHESQPRQLPNCTTQLFIGSRTLKRDLYEYKYVHPNLPVEIDPNQPPPTDEGLQHLLHVKVPLPTQIMYFEPPIVAVWDEVEKNWTTRPVVNFNSDSKTNLATFYLEKVSPFAFMIRKYVLLPYIKWSMKPRYENGGVSLSVWCQEVRFEFTVLNLQVCLSSIDGVMATFIDDLIGKYMNLHKLIAEMKLRGLNVFPDVDAFLYVHDNTAKDVVLEDHTYMSMALFCDVLEFNSSLWNCDYSRRKVFFQVRQSVNYEVNIRYKTVAATALSAQLFRFCDEDGSFDESKVETFGFRPDVYSLLDKEFSPTIPQHVLTNPLQVITTYELLSRVKVLSYCGLTRKDTTTSSSEASKKDRRKGKKGKSRLKSGIRDKTSSPSSSTSAIHSKIQGAE